MKIVYNTKFIFKTITAFFSLFSVCAVTATTQRYNATVDVDIPEITCSISTPSEIQLGNFTHGMNTVLSSKLNITVSCSNGSRKYAVYMTTPNALTSNRDGMFLKYSDGADSSIVLQLEGDNGKNQFTESSQSPKSIYEGDNSKIYTPKISVRVPKGAKPGDVKGSVSFQIIYLA